MSLKQRIQQDLKEALKQKEELKPLVLRMLLAAILNKEKEKRYKLVKTGGADLAEQELIDKSRLSDEEITSAVFYEVKKRKEAVFEYDKGGRKDLADKEQKEAEILKEYLPEQFSEEEIKKMVQEAIKKTGASQIKDMGKVMAELMPKVKGKAEGGTVSKIVKEALS